jgi:cyanophycin synthetase
LLEKIYRDAGYNVGACTTEGVTHNGALIWKGDASWGYGAWRAAECPHVDVLILETGRGGIVRYGIGFKKCQVGIVTNLYEDHLGFDGIDTLEQMAAVKSSVAKRVDRRGFLVLNADDDFVRRMAGATQATPIYFTEGNDCEQFKRVFFLRKDCIHKKIDEKEELVVNVKEMPITYGGLLRYNIANVMAVLAAIEGTQELLPINKENARKTLKEFGVNPSDNFNRFCMLTFRGERVILNYSKNPESYRRDLEVIQKIKECEKFRYVVGVLTAPGDRQEKYYNEISELVAPVCDYFFVQPPKQKYLRGKKGEEIVRQLSTSIPKDKIISISQGGLPEVIELSKKKLEGKTLFIIFYSALEADIDYWKVLKEAVYFNPLKKQANFERVIEY